MSNENDGNPIGYRNRQTKNRNIARKQFRSALPGGK